MQRAAEGLQVVNSGLLQDTPEGGERKRNDLQMRTSKPEPLTYYFHGQHDEEGAEKQPSKSAGMGCL